MNTNIGINENGYIKNVMKKENIKEPWLNAVNESIYEVKARFGENIHSLYIYGSVGRGNPKVNSSDIDFTVVLNTEITKKIGSEFEELNKELSAKFPFVREIGFDLGSVDEVMDEANYYSWGFWLKSCCACLYGEDLAMKFPSFKATKEIGQAINGDLDKWISSYKEKIKKSNNDDITKLYCQQIMKKIIRSGFSSIMEKENSWANDLKTAYDLFIKNYSDKSEIINELYQLAQNPIPDRKRIINLIDKFEWLID